MTHISIYKGAQGACIIITPALARNLVAQSAFEGRNFRQVPIYFHMGRERELWIKCLV